MSAYSLLFITLVQNRFCRNHIQIGKVINEQTDQQSLLDSNALKNASNSTSSWRKVS